MKLLQFPLFAILILVAGLILYLIFGGLFKQVKNSKRLTQKGNPAMANVISISQINSNDGGVTQLLLQVELKNADGHVRRVELKQPVDQGAIPRVGDSVYVLVNPENLNDVVLAPVPPGSFGQYPRN